HQDTLNPESEPNSMAEEILLKQQSKEIDIAKAHKKGNDGIIVVLKAQPGSAWALEFDLRQDNSPHSQVSVIGIKLLKRSAWLVGNKMVTASLPEEGIPLHQYQPDLPSLDQIIDAFYESRLDSSLATHFTDSQIARLLARINKQL
ncbi:MAG: hypothetical protein KDD62_15185, partial [Bdellovibrionales bacterium]|nr:hypothetical protein [Bdellovibrionales bacterium]